MNNLDSLAKKIRIQAEDIKFQSLMMGETPRPMHIVVRGICNQAITDKLICESDLDVLYRKAINS